MNLFHAVGRAATSEPRAILVYYKGNTKSDVVDLALVGKGITYDTGGLNLKGTGFMEEMHGDKNGACAVFGALHGVLDLKPKKNIVFAGAFAENSIDAKSYKGGDIIKSMKGLTVEIGNTDAEGRLVLSDTMTYLQREFAPKKMIDLATLTGACMVALGHETAGLFSMDDEMCSDLLRSSKRTFEPIWRLPINDEHRSVMRREHCDLSNMGKYRQGGASQAAAFLENFVEKGVRWAHLDIAGPALTSVAKEPVSKDGSGFSV